MCNSTEVRTEMQALACPVCPQWPLWLLGRLVPFPVQGAENGLRDQRHLGNITEVLQAGGSASGPGWYPDSSPDYR